MIPILITITAYNHSLNTCTAKLQNGNFITFDPFVGCGIKLSDEDYESGKGGNIVNKQYLLTGYSVYPSYVVAHENGMTEF